MPADRVVLHTDTRPLTAQGLDAIFEKARAATLLGLDFTIDTAPRMKITVHVDPKVLAAAHYAEQNRQAELHLHARASDAQNRAGLEKARAALRAVGDPDPDTTIGFVGADLAFADAQAQHLAQGFGLIDNGMPAAYDRAEQRNGRRSS